MVASFFLMTHLPLYISGTPIKSREMLSLSVADSLLHVLTLFLTFIVWCWLLTTMNMKVLRYLQETKRKLKRKISNFGYNSNIKILFIPKFKEHEPFFQEHSADRNIWNIFIWNMNIWWVRNWIFEGINNFIFLKSEIRYFSVIVDIYKWYS